MALSTTTLSNLMSRVGEGQNKNSMVFGSTAYTTTATTATATVPLKLIKAMFFALNNGTGAVREDDLTWAAAVFPKRSTVGAQDITLTRAGSTTSGLIVHWLAIGEE